MSRQGEWPPACCSGKCGNADANRQIHNWLYDVRALKSKSGHIAAGNHSATEIQAVALSSQLQRLKQIIARRRRAAAYLNRRFQKVEGIIPQLMDDKNVKLTHHLYLLQVDPDAIGGDIQVLRQKLAARGVVQIPHFAPPVQVQHNASIGL